MIKKILFVLNIFLQKVFKIKVSLATKGLGFEDDRYEYQKKYINFDIKDGEKVLDIGSGGYPFPLATHIADFFPQETTHRSEKLIKDERPFYICDICDMPFKDKEFDYSYCSHVLEHIEDPSKACDELMRVSSKGYIETPTKTSDIMFNFLKLKDHHKWFVIACGNSLVFFEYDKSERKDTGVDEFFSMFHSKYDNPFQALVRNNRKLFNNMFVWENSFDYYIFNVDGKLVKSRIGENKQ